MICRNCGAEIRDTAAFCEACGEPVMPVSAPQQGSSPLFTEKVTYCPDGKYRWVYKMSILKNPTIFLMVWKIFFFIIIGIFCLVMFFDWLEWDDFFPDRLLSDLKVMGIFIGGMTALTFISCVIYAAYMGGSYIVEFEMDEHGVVHRQIPAQAAKAQRLARATTLAGAASNNLTTAGIGINSARTEMSSDFSKVKKVKAYPRRNVIKVNETLGHNQVYAKAEDFDLVKDFIIAHCPNLK